VLYKGKFPLDYRKKYKGRVAGVIYSHLLFQQLFHDHFSNS